MTRAQIQAMMQKKQKPTPEIQTGIPNLDDDILDLDEDKAFDIENALEILNDQEVPAKAGNRKKLFEEYKEKMIEKVKLEKPGLKKSQYDALVFKEWKRSLENPTNQI